MSNFFTAKTDAQSVADGGAYISESGIYPVTLKAVSVKVNEKNARSIDFNVDYQGSSQVFYGLKLDNNDGSENFEAKVFNKLVVCAGLDGVSQPEIQTHNLGKDKKPTDLSVLTDFDDLPVKMRIQYEYNKFEGKIREHRKIKAFYREDGASASEIIALANGQAAVIGTRLAKDEKKYASNVTYKDGLTAEDVAAWKEAEKANRAAQGGNASAAQTPSENKFAGGGASTGFPA
jgi:hypothetical protein